MRPFPRRFEALLVSTFLAFAGLLSAEGSFTLDDVRSAPYPSGLVAAPKADRIAWMVNDRGVRNLWTAEAPGFEPRKLTSYEDDDGQDLGSLALSPDGSLLVFVRGGGPNAAGEIPNPSHLPDGAEQATWAVATAGGEPWKVAAGGGPVLSPEGDRVAYARGNNVFETPLSPPAPDEDSEKGGGSEKEEAAKPKPLFQARGGQSSLAYSPDGSRLSFVSNRGDHSFVGVFDLEARKITWIAPSVDRDSSPVWSADGKRLAFFRAPGALMGERINVVGGRGLAVWVADAATGEASEAWRSPSDQEFFAQTYMSQPLLWAGSERVVFVAEHDGWMHVYALDASGGSEPTDLTPGEADVESYTLSADGTTLYFAGNLGDTNRRHVWRTPTSGGRPELLTPGRGIETDPVPLAGGRHVAFRGADFRRPQAISVVSTDSKERRRVSPTELPGSFPAEKLVEPQEVIVKASDGLEIHGQLFLPAGAREADRRAAVIFMHGGPVRQMLLGWHYSGYYANCYAFNQYLANRGMVVLSVNYRSGIGYGRDFRRAENQGPRGAAEYQDILAAGLYLQKRPEVDPHRIGLWGGSYGGYLTAMGLARDSDLFAAGVDFHGVHDWAYRGENFPRAPGGFWGLGGEELLESARRSSPVADLTYWSSPVLFVHGDDDRNVMFIQTTDLVQRLRKRDVHVETLVFPDEVHGFLRHESWARAFKAAADFFERFLTGDAR